jgi:hypothetical protein
MSVLLVLKSASSFGPGFVCILWHADVCRTVRHLGMVHVGSVAGMLMGLPGTRWHRVACSLLLLASSEP